MDVPVWPRCAKVNYGRRVFLAAHVLCGDESKFQAVGRLFWVERRA